jgi:hypothetical protein
VPTPRHGGLRADAVLELQRRAGNRAVTAALAPQAATLADVAAAASARPGVTVPFPFPIDFEAVGVAATTPSSSAAPAPGGVRRIRDARGGGTRAAGYTSLPVPTPPDLVVGEPQRRGDEWVAPVLPTRSVPDRPTSLYPGPGVHDLGPGPTGQQRHLHVTDDMADLIRRGEEEHLADLEWARHLSYDAAAAVVNAAAESEPPAGRTPAAARSLAVEEVRAALPAPLRWADGEDPGLRWRRTYSRLAHVTIERDENHWHDLTSAFVLDPAEKRRLGVPAGDELTRYVGGTEVGQHPSAALVRARFAELA